jgi:hypothetical protein
MCTNLGGESAERPAAHPVMTLQAADLAAQMRAAIASTRRSVCKQEMYSIVDEKAA